MILEADLYLQLGVRHIDMAQLLIDNGFLDGALFHAYHAFECASCAGVLLVRGYVPWQHPQKLREFAMAFPDDGTYSFQPEWDALAFTIFSIYPTRRDDTLYPVVRTRHLILNDPRINYTEPQIRAILNRVRNIVQQIDSYLRSRYS